MSTKIDIDHQRYRQRLLGRAREKFFSDKGSGTIDHTSDKLRLVGDKKGVYIPRFRHKFADEPHLGMDDGEVGQLVPGMPRQFRPPGFPKMPGGREAVECYDEFDHDYVELTREEVAQGLEEYLELPNMEDVFGQEARTVPHLKYRGIRKVGPRSLTHFGRTFKQALKRTVASGLYNPASPIIIPRDEDRRVRAPREIYDTTNAVVVFLLDCSDSTYRNIDFQQEAAWFIDIWLEHNYPGIPRHYVHYDHSARESNRRDFFAIQAGGENDMGIAYLFTASILKKYGDCNKFVVHHTDGDPFGLEVTAEDVARYAEAMERSPDYFSKIELTVGNPLTDQILPHVNGLFVCEAGAYYDLSHSGARNYSTILEQIVIGTPALRNKIRLVSFDDTKIQQERHACHLETMKAFFGKS